jgi:hypothetical protein
VIAVAGGAAVIRLGATLLEMSLSENPGYFVSISRCNIKKLSRITGR